jgi:hypothetical protein
MIHGQAVLQKYLEKILLVITTAKYVYNKAQINIFLLFLSHAGTSY